MLHPVRFRYLLRLSLNSILFVFFTFLAARTRAQSSTYVGGYGEMNYQNFSNGNPPRLDISRFVIYLDHTFDSRWTFRSETEIEHVKIEGGAGGEIGIEQAYLEYRANERIGWRGGLLVLPIGIMNQTHEPNSYFSVLRPLFDQTVVPTTWAEIGTGVYGNLSKALAYQLYLSEGLQTQNSTMQTLDGAKQEGWAAAETSDTLAGSNVSRPALSGKLTFTPAEGLEIGASGYLERGPTTIFSNLFELGDLDVQYETNAWRFRAEGAYVNTGMVLPDVPAQVVGGYGELAFNLFSFTKMRSQLWAFSRFEEYAFREYTSDSSEDILGDGPTVSTIHRALVSGVAFKPMNELILKADYQWTNTDSPLEHREWALGAGYVF